MNKQYNMIIYIPIEAFETILSELQKIETNRIGNYINCMSWSTVTSTWTPIKGANPNKGTIGDTRIESEIRLELFCEEENIEEIVQTIKQHHPYEKPEIDLYPTTLL